MSTTIKNYNDKLVIINIKSHLGDKIKLNLPIDFVKKLIKNNALDFFLLEEEIVDTQKMIKSLVDAFNYNLTGDVVHLERYNGDIINIRIQSKKLSPRDNFLLVCFNLICYITRVV